MTKPFNLQSPEAIAKGYGGNKQRIAQAMQSGIIDPTAGTLAGMFIDRMRSAQMQEMAPQPTIAQQVFAPPAPMGGGLPPAPQGMAAPQMGAPPAPPAAPPAMPAPPMGMADGGLAGLPIPDTMFDEPTNGGFDDGYNHGGIVAFAGAGPVYGYSDNPMDLIEEYRRLYKPKTEASERARKLYEGDLSEEGRKKRASEDKWFALAQLGATMASTPGSLLQAASAGVNKALPGLQESAKERRAEQRDAIKQLALNEGASNEEARREADLYMQGKGRYAELKAAEDARRGEEKYRYDKMAQDERLAYAQMKAQKAIAQIGASRSANPSDFETLVGVYMRGNPQEIAAVEKAMKQKALLSPTILDPSKQAFANMFGSAGSGQGGQTGKGVVTVPWNP